nr:SpoIVB peptidase S55 [Veillonella sp.]
MKGFRSSRRYLKGVLALLFCWSVATTSAEAIDFMPVNDVRTGMEGHADTVVSGDTISSFNVKVLGVMRDRGPS